MFLIFYILLLLAPLPVSADSGHIVISEIQTYGQTATDEFVRIYNPTSSAINISSWKLTKKTSSGAESNLVSSFSDGTIIPPNSGFLIAHQTGYLGSETPNARYSGASYSMADNNTIILKNTEGTVIDKAGFGTASDYEGAPAQNPENGASIKRLNNNDADNNKNDFSADAIVPADSPAPVPPPASATTSAQYGDIVINEAVPNPSDGKEWVELFNTTTNAVSLAGWKISDGNSVINSLDGELPANNFLTVEIASRLNNSGDAVYLSDASGKSISQLIYGDWINAAVSAPEKGQSLARNDDGKFYITDTPTKNQKNIIRTIVQNMFSVENASSTNETGKIDWSKISVTEILPNPEGSDAESEYMKIKNNSDADIDLDGLYLDDAEDGSNPYKIPAGTIIKTGEEIIFYRSKTKIALNNTDDEVRILSPNKEEIFSIDYEDAEEGAIYILKNGKWQWNNSVSTVIPASAQGGSAKINSITATVIVPPNIFSTQTMYVDGLQLYMYSKDWPELKIGDKISVYGTPSTYYSEPRLKLKNKSSIKIISQNNTTEPVPAENVSEDDLGRLIIIEGEVLQIVNTKIIIDANSEEIPVYDKTKQNIFSQLKEKDQVQITGVVSQYKDEFRLLPRGADDIKILKSSVPITASKSATWKYLISTLAVGAFGGAIYLRKRKNGY